MELVSYLYDTAGHLPMTLPTTPGQG